MGIRQVTVATDEEEIIAQLEGWAGAAHSPSLTGLYLQTRAMLAAFDHVSLRRVTRLRNIDAVLAAQAALGVAREPEKDRARELWTAMGPGGQRPVGLR